MPYVVNNSGWAPRAAAELIVAAGQSVSGPLLVIEVGAGSGIFARQVLDRVKKKSNLLEMDVYDRLTFICTDCSERAVNTWKEREQFLDHTGHILSLIHI